MSARRVRGSRSSWSGVAVVVACLLVTGCSAQEESGGATSGAAEESALFEADGYRLRYPATWEIVESGDSHGTAATEQVVRIELPNPDGSELPQAWVSARFPTAMSQTLEAALQWHAVDPDDPEVEDLGEDELEVAGADEAVLQEYVVPDQAGSGHDYGYRSLVAMPADGDRALTLVLGVRDDAPLTIEEAHELVIGGLELTVDAPDDAEPDDAESEVSEDDAGAAEVPDGFVEVTGPDGRLALAVPEEWRMDPADDTVVLQPEGGSPPLLRIYSGPPGDEAVDPFDLDAEIERQFGEHDDLDVESIELPGTVEARRLEREAVDTVVVLAQAADDWTMTLLFLRFDDPEAEGGSQAELLEQILESARVGAGR